MPARAFLYDSFQIFRRSISHTSSRTHPYLQRPQLAAISKTVLTKSDPVPNQAPRLPLHGQQHLPTERLPRPCTISLPQLRTILTSTPAIGTTRPAVSFGSIGSARGKVAVDITSRSCDRTKIPDAVPMRMNPAQTLQEMVEGIQSGIGSSVIF